MVWGQWEEEEVGIERKEPFSVHLEDWWAVAGVGENQTSQAGGKTELTPALD